MKDSRFETIKKVKKKIERELISDKNIVSIGTVKETNELGQETGDYVIQIGLLSKKDKMAIDHLQIKVQALLEEFGASLKPLSDGQIKINFVEEGEIHALSRLELPSADDSVIPFSGENKHHSRPIISGLSIGHEKITAGTLGGIVRFKNSYDPVVLTYRNYILSNNHVLAYTNEAKLGDAILQPGPFDGGIFPDHRIATLTHFTHIKPQGSGYNLVDVAIAEIMTSCTVNFNVKSIGQPKEIKEAHLGMDVEKTGRTTGHTYGKIISVDETTIVKMGKFSAVFEDQIAVTAMSKGGDSGAVIFEKDKQHPVGLLFAGSPGKTYCNHMSAVRASMNRAGFFNIRFANGKRGYSTVAHRGLIKPTSMPSLGKQVTQLLRMAFK